jgi:hypothetical protein
MLRRSPLPEQPAAVSIQLRYRAESGAMFSRIADFRRFADCRNWTGCDGLWDRMRFTVTARSAARDGGKAFACQDEIPL